MLNEQSTLFQTLEAIARDAGHTGELLGGFKNASTTQELRGFFHRGEHLLQELARTMRDMLTAAPPELRLAINALAPIPAPVVAAPFPSINTTIAK